VWNGSGQESAGAGIVGIGLFDAFVNLVRPLGLACDDGLVGDGFVGVAGQGGRKAAASIDPLNAQPCPAVVGFPMNLEL